MGALGVLRETRAGKADGSDHTLLCGDPHQRVYRRRCLARTDTEAGRPAIAILYNQRLWHIVRVGACIRASLLLPRASGCSRHGDRPSHRDLSGGGGAARVHAAARAADSFAMGWRDTRRRGRGAAALGPLEAPQALTVFVTRLVRQSTLRDCL